MIIVSKVVSMDKVYAKVLSLKKTTPRFGLDTEFMKDMIGNIYKVSKKIDSTQYLLYNEKGASSYSFDSDDLEVFTEDDLSTGKQDNILAPLLFDINELNI